MKTATRKPQSAQAQAAAMIRKNLKAAYPATKFAVTSSSFAGGDAVNIDWIDGPTKFEIEELTNPHQYGHFDGMQDLYEYTNRREDIPQAKYVQCQRRYSPDQFRAAVAWLNARYGWSMEVVTNERYPEYVSVDPATDAHTGNGWRSHEVGSVLFNSSATCPECKQNIIITDAYCPECGAKQDGPRQHRLQ